MKIKLFSLGLKGYRVIKAIKDKMPEHRLFCVIGKDGLIDDDYSIELETYCIQHGIDYVIRDEVHPEDSFDIAIAIGWKWIISDIPDGKLIVIHDSLLPKYRGFAPLVNALLKKEPCVGVTALIGVEKYDQGPILLQKKMQVFYPTTIGHELNRMSDLYVELSLDLINILSNNPYGLIGECQNENEATYSLWLDEDDYRIDWNKSADNIAHFVNCVGYPYKGATTLLNGNLIKIINVKSLSDVKIENRHLGKVIFIENDCPLVVCGEGLLMIEKALDLNGESILPLKLFRSRFS